MFICPITWNTPRKTNMEPENEPLEEEIPIRNHHFQVQNVSFRGGYVIPKSLKLGHWLSEKMKKTKPVLFLVELLPKLEVYGVSFSKYTFPLKLPSSLGFIWLFV